MDDCKIAAPRQCFRLEEPAPNFSAPAYYRGREIEVCLRDFRGSWLLLFFYSSDFTFV
ncbi:AhpC/TSA family protein [Sporolituus thermophilus DSM 23256]|uniref:AhpC/TSA family protein n=2 Tax=Sporolituus TaxID=909931 RepID=A0A1G7IN99_9FIRM|nr:AhpC/TSA family protein [Sporolituus thermophilus DSM 23256]